MSVSKDLSRFHHQGQSKSRDPSDEDIDDKNDIYKKFEGFDFEHDQRFQNGWSSVLNVVEPSKIGVEYLKAKVFFFSKYYKPINLEKYISWKKASSSKSNGTAHTGNTKCESQELVKEDLCKNNIDDTSIASNPSQNTDGDVNNSAKPCSKMHCENNGACSTSPNSVCTCDSLSKLLHSTSLDNNINKNCNIVERDIGCDDGNEKNEYISHLEENGSNSNTAENVVKEDNESSLSLLEVANYIQKGLPIPGLVSLEVHPTNQQPTSSSQDRKLKPWEKQTTGTAES